MCKYNYLKDLVTCAYILKYMSAISIRASKEFLLLKNEAHKAIVMAGTPRMLCQCDTFNQII